MTEIKHPHHLEEEKSPVQTLQNFWEGPGRKIAIALAVVIVAVAGYFIYQSSVQEPKERKAAEAMFHAEEYFRNDSVRLALQGDNANPGFVKIISKYGGTKAADLAAFYAGSCYLKLGDFNNAVKYLKDFSTKSPQVQAKADGLLGDAYSELNRKEEAVAEYKKAASVFEQDDALSPEYLFRAGYLYESMGKTAEAIQMYQVIKDKYPGSQRGFEIDKYLARLGVIK